MKNNLQQRLINWSLVSVSLFLIVNWLMTIKGLNLNTNTTEVIRTSLIAVVLYAIPLVLIKLNIKVSYYLLAVVTAIYTVGFVGVIGTMYGNSSVIILRIIIAGIALFGLVVNVYWYMMVFRLRNQLQQREIKHKLEK